MRIPHIFGHLPYLFWTMLVGIVFQTSCDADVSKITPNSPLNLEVKFNKKLYVLGEPITTSFNIVNTTARSINGTWFSYDNGFNYRIYNSDKEYVRLYGVISEVQQITTSWKVAIPPSSSVSTDLDIVVGDVAEVSPFFLRGESWDPLGSRVEYALPAGSYTLVASHRDFSVRDISKPLIATAAFQIRVPIGEEMAALELFKKRPYASYNKQGELAQSLSQAQSSSIKAYETIVKQYPNTPYAPYAQYYIGRILQIQGKPTDAASAYSALLSKYPQFSLKADALFYMSSSYAQGGHREKALSALRALKKEFPHHLIAPNITYLEELSRVDTLEQKLNSPLVRSAASVRADGK